MCFPSGQIVLYIVFMVFPLENPGPKILSKAWSKSGGGRL